MAFQAKALTRLGQLACFVVMLNGCGSGSSANTATNTATNTAANNVASPAVPATSAPSQTGTVSPRAPAAPTPPNVPTPPAVTATNKSPVSATNSSDACLPITMPASDDLFNSPKKVFAHYFDPFPLSIDNKPSAQDYYNDQYLNRDGEDGKWQKQGGYLRQRPLGVDTSANPHWRQLNMQREVTTAIARGITGFTFDVLSLNEATNAASDLHLMLNAAQAVDSRFKIVVMPDITALGSDASAVMQIIASVADSPAAYKLADGRLVVSAFDASLNSPAWWGSVIIRLKTQGINVAFVPTFLGWGQYASLYASVSYGFADWGTATAHASSQFQDDASIAHGSYNKIFMMPVDPQQYRPKNFQFWEAGNSASFRSGWISSIRGDSDWVQLVTWNDLSETSQIAPYTDATLKRHIGTGYYDLNGFYAAWFLTGQEPKITHDVLYYFYRREATSAKATRQGQAVHITGDAAENDIELLAFLTTPGELKITVGGKTYTQNAAAGMVSFKVPSQPGVPLFTLSRNGSDVFSFEGGVQIFGANGVPSGVADMTYWSGSAAQSGICSL